MSPADQTILIADDDPAQRLLVEAALTGAGFLVVTAVDGAAAVESYSRSPTDCVILDVMMPNLTGIEACRAIRERTDGRLLPILMLTGRNDLSAITEAYAAGASDFAQKGLNPRLLVERVRFLLRDRELQDQLWSSRSKLLLAQRIARVGHWEIDAAGRSLDVSPFIYELLDTRTHAIERYEEFVCLLDPVEQDGGACRIRRMHRRQGRLQLRSSADDGVRVRDLPAPGGRARRGRQARAMTES